MPSQKKRNTYGVESPCGYSPGVGSFLTNPGLSKEQLVPSCEMRTFVLQNSFIGIMALYLRSCVVATFAVADVFIRMFPHFAIYLFVCYP